VSSAPISLIPGGLLGFFQIKNGGQNPAELGKVIAPVMDALNWYADYNCVEELQGQRSHITAEIGDFSATTALTPPVGQWWLVRGVQMYWPVNATDIFVQRLIVARNNNGTRYPIRQSETGGLAAGLAAPGGAGGRLTYCQVSIPGPFIMVPGDEIMQSVQDILVAAPSLSYFRALIYRFSL